MVVALRPGKFYGSSLPRPRFYTDVKFNDQRIDPPVPVMDPLISWAEEAHWSMGGLSFTRHRLQGRIEGNVNKLRVQRETSFKKSPKQKNPINGSAVEREKNGSRVGETPSPPPAPMVIKRRRVVGLVDEDEEGEDVQKGVKRGTARKLGDDFERVARESGMVPRTRSRSNEADMVVNEGEGNKLKRKLVKGGRKVAAPSTPGAGSRSSPRLAGRSPTVR